MKLSRKHALQKDVSTVLNCSAATGMSEALAKPASVCFEAPMRRCDCMVVSSCCSTATSPSCNTHPRTLQKVIFERPCNEHCFVVAALDSKAKSTLKGDFKEVEDSCSYSSSGHGYSQRGTRGLGDPPQPNLIRMGMDGW